MKSVCLKARWATARSDIWISERGECLQDIARIHKSIEDGEFRNNPKWKDLGIYKKIGFITSYSGTSIRRWCAFISGSSETAYNTADNAGLKKVYIHAFTDGRDTPPESALGFIRELEIPIKDYSAIIASVSGRYYAMITAGKGSKPPMQWRFTGPGLCKDDITAEEIVLNSYANGITDEFIKPCSVCARAILSQKISTGDLVIFFNYRADRAREISIARTVWAAAFETKT